MVQTEAAAANDERPLIAASMFGNTTAAVDHARGLLEGDGYEVLVFHATGSGGRTMEDLISDGYIAGCLDMTTTELADEICGGVYSAGPERVQAAPGRASPRSSCPGCVDMANFGGIETVPTHYREAACSTNGTRKLPSCAPMRRRTGRWARCWPRPPTPPCPTTWPC